MKTAIIYARYSSERQTEQSIEGQIRVCKEFATQNDLKIIDTYIDRATTGTNDNREAFQRMLSDSAKAVWEIVLVYAIDRFGRNSIEIAVNKQKLIKNGKILISATQRMATNIDGSKNLDGILLENVLIGLSEYYSAELAQKVRRGLHENRIKGYFSGGRIPYGYVSVPAPEDPKGKRRILKIDEDKAKIVRYIFNEHLNGKVVPQIIDDLAEQGVFYNREPFGKSTIYQLMRNERYTGIVYYGGEVYNNIFPQIIDRPTFDAVQEILKKNQLGGKSAYVEYLLHQKIHCGNCGWPMHGESGTSRSGATFNYYKCQNRKKKKNCDKKSVRKDAIEKIVLDITHRLFDSEENRKFLAAKIMEIHNQKDPTKSIMNLLCEDKANTERAINNIINAMEQGIITDSTKERLLNLETHKKEINEKILLEQMNEQKRLKEEDVLKFLKKAITKAPGTMLYVLLKDVLLFDDKVEIYYNYIDKTNTDTPPEDTSIIDCSGLENLSAPIKIPSVLLGFLL
ncbi:MAG: recombinase family protein [Christensenellales bacterium]